MLNYIKLVKQIRQDYLKGKLKERYTYQDLIANRITSENVDEYAVDGTFLEDAALDGNLYEITNTKEEFFLFVTIDDYNFIANYVI